MRRALALAAAALAACATPEAPPGSPEAAAEAPRPRYAMAPSSGAREAAIARHEKLARAARETGDPAQAAAHYEVLALLDATRAEYRDGLAAANAAIDAGVQEHLRAAAAARRGGDAARAREAWLRVLVLDPDNGEAAKGLRELEQAAMARTQAERAARARSMDDIVASARARATADGVYDLEQRLELIRSSEPSIALREARAWAEANPADRAGRARVAAALVERGRDTEAKGPREAALGFYDLAASLGGNGQADAGKRAAALRGALAEDAYANGMRLRSTDLAAAIRAWETALRYDPGHARAKERLAEARAAQRKLERIAK